MSDWGGNPLVSPPNVDRKQLPLRQNKDKPVLKYNGVNGIPGGMVPPGVGTSNQGAALAKEARLTGTPIFNNNIDTQAVKQPSGGMYGMAGMASMFATSYGNSNTASAAAYTNNNYLYMSGTGTPSGMGVTPAQILSTAIQTSTKQNSNPYARPVSVTDIQSPEYFPRAVVKASNSSTSISSNGNSSRGSSPVSKGNTVFQTNSFMRPTTATLRKQSEKADSPSKTSKEAVTPRSMTPSATSTVLHVQKNPPTQSSLVQTSTPTNEDNKPFVSVPLPPSVAKPPPSPRPQSGKIAIKHMHPENMDAAKVFGKSVSTPEMMRKPPTGPTGKKPDSDSGSSPGSVTPTFFIGSPRSGIGSPSKSGHVITKPPVSPHVNRNARVSPGSKSNTPTKTGPGATADSSSDEGSSRPNSSSFRPGTPAADMAAKVRNLNYTPTKPYQEVSDTDSNPSVGQTPSPVNSESNLKMVHKFVPRNIKNNVTKVSNNEKKNMNPHLDSEDMNDPSLKKMPVTNTLTGTIYYRKASKSEEVIHDLHQRPLSAAEGAPAKAKKVEPRIEEVGEEWEDDDEEEEDDDCVGPGSERVPGDGEDFDDFDDDDDGIDGLEDDLCDSDDNSDGYSIRTSSSSTSRGGSATSLRVRSATQRMASLSLKERAGSARSRPMTGRVRSGSSISSGSSDGDLQPALMPSLFPNIPPTVNFVVDGQKVEQLPWEYRRLLKWRMSPITPNVVKNCIARSGFRATKKNHDWIGYWGKHMKAQGFKTIREYQKVNHFPGSFQIGRKDRLWRNLSRMQLHYGKKEFGFFPQTFVLPFDMKQLKRAWEDGGTKQKWIIKPPASARGIGIKVIHKWNQIPKRRPVIVQKYLARPYLINESKFDMRLYVYVTSYDPLRIYLYEDGLARFASTKYSHSMKSLANKYMHLTNYSIQKKSNEYESNANEKVCQGHKWGLKALWGYMKKQGINTSAIWENIKDLLIKTIISSEACVNSMVKMNVRRKYCCHELFGFDVMLDENLKPWIIEVNISPSLHSNSPLDLNIKGGMIKDLLNICGFVIPDKVDVSPLGPSIVDSSKWTPPNPVCIDRRLYPSQCAPDERAKHAYYSQRSTDEFAMSTILDILTPDDLRLLAETIDEDSRRGSFQRIYPSHHSYKYSRFFEQPRYYNLLVDAWVQKYLRMEARAQGGTRLVYSREQLVSLKPGGGISAFSPVTQPVQSVIRRNKAGVNEPKQCLIDSGPGISYLESLCHRGLHLEYATDDPKHQWAPPSMTIPGRCDPRVVSAPVTPKSGSGGSLPFLKRRKPKSQGSNSSLSSLGSRDTMATTPGHRHSAPVDPS